MASSAAAADGLEALQQQLVHFRSHQGQKESRKTAQAGRGGPKDSISEQLSLATELLQRVHEVGEGIMLSYAVLDALLQWCLRLVARTGGGQGGKADAAERRVLSDKRFWLVLADGLRGGRLLVAQNSVLAILQVASTQLRDSVGTEENLLMMKEAVRCVDALSVVATSTTAGRLRLSLDAYRPFLLAELRLFMQEASGGTGGGSGSVQTDKAPCEVFRQQMVTALLRIFRTLQRHQPNQRNVFTQMCQHTLGPLVQLNAVCTSRPWLKSLRAEAGGVLWDAIFGAAHIEGYKSVFAVTAEAEARVAKVGGDRQSRKRPRQQKACYQQQLFDRLHELISGECEKGDAPSTGADELAAYLSGLPMLFRGFAQRAISHRWTDTKPLFSMWEMLSKLFLSACDATDSVHVQVGSLLLTSLEDHNVYGVSEDVSGTQLAFCATFAQFLVDGGSSEECRISGAAPLRTAYCAAFSSLVNLNYLTLHDRLHSLLATLSSWCAFEQGNTVKPLLLHLIETYRRLRQMQHLVGALMQPSVTRHLQVGSDEGLSAAFSLAFQVLPEGQISELWTVFASELAGGGVGGEEAQHSILRVELLFKCFIKNVRVTTRTFGVVSKLCASFLASGACLSLEALLDLESAPLTVMVAWLDLHSWLLNLETRCRFWSNEDQGGACGGESPTLFYRLRQKCVQERPATAEQTYLLNRALQQIALHRLQKIQGVLAIAVDMDAAGRAMLNGEAKGFTTFIFEHAGSSDASFLDLLPHLPAWVEYASSAAVQSFVEWVVQSVTNPAGAGSESAKRVSQLLSDASVLEIEQVANEVLLTVLRCLYAASGMGLLGEVQGLESEAVLLLMVQKRQQAGVCDSDRVVNLLHLLAACSPEYFRQEDATDAVAAAGVLDNVFVEHYLARKSNSQCALKVLAALRSFCARWGLETTSRSFLYHQVKKVCDLSPLLDITLAQGGDEALRSVNENLILSTESLLRTLGRQVVLWQGDALREALSDAVSRLCCANGGDVNDALLHGIVSGLCDGYAFSSETPLWGVPRIAAMLPKCLQGRDQGSSTSSSSSRAASLRLTTRILSLWKMAPSLAEQVFSGVDMDLWLQVHIQHLALLLPMHPEGGELLATAFTCLGDACERRGAFKEAMTSLFSEGVVLLALEPRRALSISTAVCALTRSVAGSEEGCGLLLAYLLERIRMGTCTAPFDSACAAALMYIGLVVSSGRGAAFTSALCACAQELVSALSTALCLAAAGGHSAIVLQALVALETVLARQSFSGLRARDVAVVISSLQPAVHLLEDEAWASQGLGVMCRLVSALLKHYPRKAYKCASPLTSTCRLLLRACVRASAKAPGDTPLGDVENPAKSLGRLLQRMADHVDVLRRYTPYLLVEFIGLQREATFSMPATVKAELMGGVFALVDTLSSFEIQHLNGLLGPAERVLFQHVYADFQRSFKYKGRV